MLQHQEGDQTISKTLHRSRLYCCHMLHRYNAANKIDMNKRFLRQSTIEVFYKDKELGTINTCSQHIHIITNHDRNISSDVAFSSYYSLNITKYTYRPSANAKQTRHQFQTQFSPSEAIRWKLHDCPP